MFENEILGTIVGILFAACVVAFIKFMCFTSTAPVWVAVVFSLALGGVAIWELVKIGKYWLAKLKEKHGNK